MKHLEGIRMVHESQDEYIAANYPSNEQLRKMSGKKEGKMGKVGDASESKLEQ